VRRPRAPARHARQVSCLHRARAQASRRLRQGRVRFPLSLPAGRGSG
jgi:hypothetical protein